MKDSLSQSSSLSLLAEVCLGSALGPEIPALATVQGGLVLEEIRKDQWMDTEEVEAFLFAFEDGIELVEVVLGCHVTGTESGDCCSEMLEGRIDVYIRDDLATALGWGMCFCCRLKLHLIAAGDVDFGSCLLLGYKHSKLCFTCHTIRGQCLRCHKAYA